MRISYILDTFGGGGKERRCLQLIQGLNHMGITDIQVIVIDNGVSYHELYDTTAKIEILGRKDKKLGQLQTICIMYKLIKGFKPDIVQAWGLMSAGFVLLVKPFIKFKFLASYVADCDIPNGLEGIVNLICNRVCIRIISNSRAGLLAYKTPAFKSVLIYNGYNEARFNNIVDHESKKEQLAINTKYVVAMVASFWQNKDWQCFIDAAKIIIERRQDITFLAVGKGPQWEHYNRQVRDKEREYLRMIGRRDDVDEIYQICDLTVLTSNHGEGISNSIMESMAWGVPVIATNKGGTPEIIEDDINGKLINEQTSDTVSCMIASLIDDPIKLAQMGKNAANTVKRKFLLHSMTEDYINLYKEICK